MCEPRLLFAGRPELLPSVADRPIIEWMWDGKDTKAAVESFLEIGMLSRFVFHAGIRFAKVHPIGSIGQPFFKFQLL